MKVTITTQGDPQLSGPMRAATAQHHVHELADGELPRIEIELSSGRILILEGDSDVTLRIQARDTARGEIIQPVILAGSLPIRVMLASVGVSTPDGRLIVE